MTSSSAGGIDASEMWHGAPFLPADGFQRPDPKRTSYGSFFSFNDPDGNTWLVQEVTTRHPGRIDPATTIFASANDLASAMRRAAAAHGDHEKRNGQNDGNWPAWYAAYMAAEQAGTELPKVSDYRLCRLLRSKKQQPRRKNDHSGERNESLTNIPS